MELQLPGRATRRSIVARIGASALAVFLLATHTTDAHADEPRSLFLPVLLGSAGASLATAGVILLAAAPTLPSTCDADTKTCSPQPGQSTQDFVDDQDRAGRAHAMPLAGWVTVGLGGMLVAAGALTYLFGTPGRSRSSSGRATIAPFASATGGGAFGALTF